MAESIGDLPEGMVTEILLQLPVKSLLQCKSVCKLWLSIISNPYIIKSHLHRAIIASINNPSAVNIEYSQPNENEMVFNSSTQAVLSTLDECTAELQQQRRPCRPVKEGLSDMNRQDLSSSPVHFDRLVMPHLFNYSRVISSYNGIICVADYFGRAVYLWNPSIRQCKKLPSFKPYATRLMPIKIGFGYDSISNDYKVVRIVFEKVFDVVPIIQVYSTNADSWKAFQEPVLNNWTVYKPTNIVVNGVMYFDGGDELISFNLHKEAFVLVPFPSFIQRKRSHVMDFECSVAMVFEYGLGIDLWTLDDVSGQMSWTKKFSIHTDPRTELRLSCYLGAGQFYGTKFCDRDYLLYNVFYDYKKRETNYYRLGEENVHANLNYTETLISLNGFQPLEANAN